MKLCLPLIKDEIPYSSDILHASDALTLCRYLFLCDENDFKSGFVYLANAENLPDEFTFSKTSALICIGKPPRKYNTSGMQLLILSENVDLLTLANEVGNVFQRYNDLRENLDAAVQVGKGLQELVGIMHPFIGNELNIGDSTHHLVAHSYDTFHNLSDSGFDVDIIEGQDDVMLPVDVIAFFSNSKTFAETKTTKEPFIFDEGIFVNRLLCVNIIYDVEYALRVIIGETERPFRTYDDSLLVFFSEYVKKTYKRVSVSGETQKMNRLADILQSVLAGEEVETWRLKRGLSVLDNADKPLFLCMCVRPNAWDVSNTTTLYYIEQITRQFRGIVVIEFQEDIICLVDVSLYSSAVQTFLQEITPFFRDNNFRVGISETFRDIAFFKDSYVQAEAALAFGIIEKPSDWVYRFKDHAVDIILKEAGKKIGSRTLCADKIFQMHEYDRNHGSEYLETADRYYFNNLNITKTAQDLKIHRTTLLYRLGRIEELFDLDFHNSKKTLFYRLSIHLLKTTDHIVR